MGVWWILGFLMILLTAVLMYVRHARRRAERQKCYDAADKLIKEAYLNLAICNQKGEIQDAYKKMLYLKWKDCEKQGYVFDPEKPVRIGRDPENNEICIQDETVSSRHCILFLYQDRLFLRDLNSRNGTWIRHGFRRRPVQGTMPVFSGDRVIVADLVFRITLFTFDMAHL